MQRSTAVPHRGYPLPCPLPVPTMAFGLKMLACKGFPYQFNSIQVKLSIQYKEDETSADIVGVSLAFGLPVETPRVCRVPRCAPVPCADVACGQHARADARTVYT